MMALPFASALPPGCHPFPQHPDDDDTINPAFLLSAPYSMTKNDAAAYAFAGQQPALAAGDWQLDVSLPDQSFAQAPFFAPSTSDATKSPGRNSHQHLSEADDTASPTSQIVYTPSSSHEYHVWGNDSSERAPEDEDDSSRSPLSDSIFSSTTDSSFYMVPSAGYPEVGEPLPTGPQMTTLMDPRPQPASSGASAHPSRASSVANPSTPNHTTAAQWNASLSTREYLMGNNADDLPSGAFTGSDGFGFGSDAFDAQGQGLQHDWMQSIATPNNGATSHLRNVTQSSFRSFDNGAHFFDNFSYSAGSYGQVVPPARELREQQHYFPHQYRQSQAMFPPQPMMQDPAVSRADYTQASMPTTSSLMVDQPAAISSSAATMPASGNIPIPSQRGVVVHAPQSATTSRAAPYHAHPNQISTTHRNPHHRRSPNTALASSSATAPSKRFQLAPRQDNRLVVPSNGPSAAAQAASHRKGGRARHMHLADDVRQQTSKMRGVRSCWRCALQRDKCDEGYPCRRCAIRSQKGQPDLLGCDRSKLPEWLDDLLPLSMTELHTKASIETFVAQQVSGWNPGNCIDIYLTSGYGPALMWRCCEFRPRGSELLGQLQYLQNTNAGRQEGKMKYAPPFALEKLDEADDERFQKYLNHQLMHPEALKTLPWTFYEEECMVDEQCFQAQMLDYMCILFAETQDVQLREALQDIIRMLIVTYIMGHTLTIAEDTLPTVLARVRYTGEIEPHTSPRLANRQLKYYFSNLRNRTFNTVLHRQQQTFHDSKKKEAHWLVSFCAMLGFAMVLEETQRTIQIQADAKETKGEMTREQANSEALTHCRRIDEKYEKLICFFQKKYRDRKWDHGSFGNRTPSYRTLPESNFLGDLYELLLTSRHHLQARESVPLGPEHQCKYTSRLVAKFLLPFLNLAT